MKKNRVTARTKNLGYTLPEVLAVVSIIGVLSTITGPMKAWYENSLGNGTNQTVGLFNLIRMRAISTTSAYRIKPDPLDPNTKFKVEISKTRGCESSTQLIADATREDTELSVASARGLVVGDSIKVGNDKTSNEIIATDTSTITLGEPLGSSQTANSTVELVNNWLNDPNFVEEDLSLPKDIEMSSNYTDWTLCFDSRGIANLYDAYGVVNSNLTLTLGKNYNNKTNEITVLQGGSIKVGS